MVSTQSCRICLLSKTKYCPHICSSDNFSPNNVFRKSKKIYFKSMSKRDLLEIIAGRFQFINFINRKTWSDMGNSKWRGRCDTGWQHHLQRDNKRRTRCGDSHLWLQKQTSTFVKRTIRDDQTEGQRHLQTSTELLWSRSVELSSWLLGLQTG